MDIAQWGQIPDGFSFDLLSEDVGYFWTPEADAEGAHAKADYSIHNYPTGPGTGSEQTSPHSSRAECSHSQGYNIPGNNNDVEADDGGRSRNMGRPRFPVQSSRDITMNRIQRRRIQNRNSQRIYRQRRVEERHKFETRALEAERTANELRIHMGELHSMVTTLRHQVEQLKVENATLRHCAHCEM